jgi:hypothetical protein
MTSETADQATTREALERRIAEIQDEQHRIAVQIGQAVLKGLELQDLRARRRELHDEIQDCFDALTTVVE